MENQVLKDIVEYAVKRLNSAYGFCGLAQAENVAMINSDDGDGGEIKISIKIEKD